MMRFLQLVRAKLKLVGYASSVIDVINAPGKLIYPSELAKGLQILAEGGDIDYVGGSAVELIGNGEPAGTFREFESHDGAFKTLRTLPLPKIKRSFGCDKS
ncbi:hypothetical protein [Sulfitobacter sp.]|uniref:hypothetical protein n=1 Tax=Sulfitobacter sp. TaxID=1903071 RepID=UPI003FCEE460